MGFNATCLKPHFSIDGTLKIGNLFGLFRVGTRSVTIEQQINCHGILLIMNSLLCGRNLPAYHQVRGCFLHIYHPHEIAVHQPSAHGGPKDLIGQRPTMSRGPFLTVDCWCVLL